MAAHGLWEYPVFFCVAVVVVVAPLLPLPLLRGYT